MEKENEANDSLEVGASTSRDIQKGNQSENSKMDEETGGQIRDLNNEELNEALEAFAQNYNLTAQNVKNIIFHIVKNPQTFATLVRKDPDAMAGLRMTRSRLRQLERIAKRQIPSVRLRPISGPKTFLDVNYDENEEEDADYNPGNDRKNGEQNDAEQNEGGQEEEDEDEDDEDGSSYTSETNSSVDEEEEEEAGRKTEEEEAERTIGGAQRLVIVEEDEERRGEAEREAQGAEFLTEVDNPIYPLFIKSVVADDGEMDPNVRQQLYDEDNDPEYVFQEFDEFCEREEKYEFRRDRATEIPRWEVRALEQDFEDEDQGVPTPLDVPVEPLAMTGKGTEPKGTQIGREKTSNTATGMANNATKVGAETVDHQNDPTEEREQGKGGPDTAVVESCSLLEQSVRFTEQEIKALKVQLEKHVQLICQTIVGTSHNPTELLGIRNKAVIMLRELDELWQQRGEQSMFNVPTLDAAIYTAHDIEACREVNLALKEHHDRQPTNEVMWVLSRSGAVRYPELLCPYRFSVHPQLHSPFLPSEQLLLALGLYQLGGVPHTNRNDVKKGRYPLIQQHFLPNKTVTQIRNHLKNVRSCPSPGIFHKIIMQAERGSFPVSYRPDLGEKAQPGIPIEWPEQMQPYWLKWLGVLLRESNPQMIMMDENNEQQTEKCSNRDNDEHELDGDNGESTANANIVVRRMGPKEGGEIDGRSGDQLQPIQSSEKWRILIPTRMTRKRLRLSNGAAEPEEQVRIPVKEELIVRVGEEAVEEGSKRRRRDSSTGGEDGFMASAKVQSTLTSGPDENSNEQFPAMAGGNCTVVHRNVKCEPREGHGGEGEEGAQSNGNETQLQQRKSRKKQRTERGIAALCDQRARDQTTHALVEAVYEDFKKRMFMHQDKLRSIQQVLARPDLSVAQCFDQLWIRMGSTHPQLFFLFAAIAPESELAPELRYEPNRLACKRALRMVHTIQTYMGGTRSATQLRNTLKFLKGANDQISTEQQLFEALQRHFGLRDEPLWKLLRREWMSAKFDEKVEDWEFECVDLDITDDGPMDLAGPSDFEFTRIPYRHDPTERSRLRVRHGRVTVELNGKLRNVAIGYPQEGPRTPSGDTTTKTNCGPVSDESNQCPSTLSDTLGTAVNSDSPQSKAIRWSREMDTALLLCHNKAAGKRQKCVTDFLNIPKWKGIVNTEDEVGCRLDTLLEVARRLREQKKTARI